VDSARVWALLYSRTGDNNQALALARSIGLPFESKRLKYNCFRDIGRFLGPSFLTLDPPSRRRLAGPWPDYVIAIGRWSVPVARAIKARSGGKTRIIFLGNPRVDPRHFDLVSATSDYLFPRGYNVVVTPLPLALPPIPAEPDTTEPDWSRDLPHPRTLLLIGASVKYWMLSESDLRTALLRLIRKANEDGGSVLVSGSPRTPDALLDVARRTLAEARHGQLAPSRSGGLAALFQAADEIFVTGDSMSMVTEAILTGKPVGLLPLAPSARGRRKLGPAFAAEGSRSRRRDLRRFWSDLWAQGLAGTLAAPKATTAARSAALAAHLAMMALGPTPASSGPEAATPARLGPFRAVGTATAKIAEEARRDIGALWLAARDKNTPWYAKLVAGAGWMFAVSPIDLTPDSLSGIGDLDDPILLVMGMILAIGCVPRPLMSELRDRAANDGRRSANRGVLTILLLWVTAGLRFVRLIH
jgi:mitochondrial fission protein ELM1/uncharacterized membrane protein YkvA (DUF1232 family)